MLECWILFHALHAIIRIFYCLSQFDTLIWAFIKFTFHLHRSLCISIIDARIKKKEKIRNNHVFSFSLVLFELVSPRTQEVCYVCGFHLLVTFRYHACVWLYLQDIYFLLSASFMLFRSNKMWNTKIITKKQNKNIKKKGTTHEYHYTICWRTNYVRSARTK